MMHVVTKRRLLVLLIGVVALAAVACDKAPPPMVITNAMEDTVVLRFFQVRDDSKSHLFGDGSYVLRFRGIDERVYYERFPLPPGTTTEIEFAVVIETSEYPLVVSDTSGEQLFRRDFLLQELYDQDWEVTITPEGIK